MTSVTFAFFETSDQEAMKAAAEMLQEGRTYPIDKRWSVRVDRSHADQNSKHNHVQFNGRDVAIINDDGTPSHNSDLSRIPNHIMNWMRKNNLTEAYLLTESSLKIAGVPVAVVAQAVTDEMMISRAGEYLARMKDAGH